MVHRFESYSHHFTFIHWINKFIEINIVRMNINFFVSEFFISFAILLLISWPLYLKSYSLIVGQGRGDLFLICKNFTLLVFVISFFIIYINFDISFYFHGYSFYINNFTNFFKLLVLFCSFLIICSINKTTFSKWEFPYGLFELFPLILFNILGILCFLSSETFLTAYITLELQSLTLALLFAFKYFSKYSSESGLKYFIISSFSTALLLLGFGFLYGVYGVIHFEGLLYLTCYEFLNVNNILNFTAEQNIVLFALSLICISFLIKLGTVPFHMWTLDVYEGAPMLVTLYALVIPKIAYLVFLLKFVFYSFNDFTFLFYNIFFYTGIFSIMFGSLGALLQTKIKRLFAYSAIANFGYVMLALSGDYFFNIVAAVTFIFIYVFVTCSLFFIFLGLKSRIDGGKIKSIFQFSSIINSGNSVLGFIFALFLFTIASIPPFNMYIAKYFLLYSLILDSSIHSTSGALIVVLFSVISCFYYIRMIRLIYFKNQGDFFNFVPYYPIQRNVSLLISFILILNLFFFVYPNLFFNLFIYIILS